MAERSGLLSEREVCEVTWTMVQVARQLIGRHLVRTPLVRDEGLSDLIGGHLFLKRESSQVTGSFKVRGALVKVLASGKNRWRKGLVCASTGNHGKGVAYLARLLETDAWVVVPERTPTNKVRAIKELGANVLVYGDDYCDAELMAFRLAEERQAVLAPSFDDPWVVAAHCSIVTEILEECPDLEVVIAPVGGGALVASCLLVRDHMKPSLRVIAVEAEGAPALTAALRAGEPVRLPFVNTVADGIAVPQIGSVPFRILSDRLSEPVVQVTDEMMDEGIRYLIRSLGIIAEHAGAAAVAAVLSQQVDDLHGRRVACLITGGNIAQDRLATILTKER
ncbi:MAG: threonine/serine dehydratase [Armatimonadetes bacterium]|nr:threonine/serine dehydratase [Armatimonadota bacterium]MDW8123013.1 threonine/serine dehydratase [Armatimonadota bacterium]